MAKLSSLLLGALLFLACESAVKAAPTANCHGQCRETLARRDPIRYSPTWESVNTHVAAPEWFQDAKFGIYFHWGIYSTAAYWTEWYPRDCYNVNSEQWKHHVSVYGNPATEWPVNNFIDGAKDKSGKFVQFAPKLKSQGGKFDPDEWAQLFFDAGAKYAGPVAEHHDGYSLWNSTVNEWNSVQRGPKLDLAQLHADAIRKKGLKFIMALHHAYNFNGYYEFAPQQPTESLQKLFGQLDRAKSNQLYVDKIKEVIDRYMPDMLYQDWNLFNVDESKLLEFLAYYFNAGLDKGVDVVATYKDGMKTTNGVSGAVFDFERGGPADLNTTYWMTDDTVSSNSWCYVNTLYYYPTNAILHAFIDRVSKGGNLLLSIAPMEDGTIPNEQKNTLLAIGDFLKKNGEAIYSTRAWKTYGEGPTKMGGGTGFQAPTAGTGKDIRFTRSKDGKILYATVLGWPGSSISIASLKSGADLSGLQSVQLINGANSYVNLSYAQSSTGLNVNLPAASAPFSALAYTMKLSFANTVPA
ncbi:alpha-L-fucosidase [Cladochytrium replicatum]|nr:alpha-L-fucosidase [Cladochytrium replicatum]